MIKKSKRTKSKRTKSKRTKSKRTKSKRTKSKRTKRTKSKRTKKPKIGDKVEIHIKPYKGYKVIGIVKRVLTKKQFHTRGHKVLLENGKIGRITRIIKQKKK